MYIRVEGQTIRYRISREEAEILIDGQELTQTTQFSDDYSLTYNIKITEEASCFSAESHNKLFLLVNRQKLISEIEGRPSKQGIEIPTADKSNHLLVNLEINLKNKSL